MIRDILLLYLLFFLKIFSMFLCHKKVHKGFAQVFIKHCITVLNVLPSMFNLVLIVFSVVPSVFIVVLIL